MSATLKLTHKTIGAEVRRGTYDVVVDGKPAGSVELNETIDIPVEPGHHTLQVRNGRNSQGARRLQPLVRGARGGTPETSEAEPTIMSRLRHHPARRRSNRRS